LIRSLSKIVKYFAIRRTVPSIEPSPIFDVYIGLGANLGDRKRNIEEALDMLGKTQKIKVLSVSKLYETAPVGITNQPTFLNAAAKITTELKPLELLTVCQNIEAKLKRVRTVRWGPRTIDIDLLLYGDLIINTKKLILPHPEMHKRAFVLNPLSDIAPKAVHPILGKTIKELSEILQK